MHCYNHHCIARLGERIGRPLKVDLNTISGNSEDSIKVERGRYARICVELDLQMKLVPRIIAAEQVFNIEYEGLNLICFDCGRYGHRKESCAWKNSNNSQMQTDLVPPGSNGVPGNVPMEVRSEKEQGGKQDPFGPWMFVSRSSKPRRFKWDGQQYGTGAVGARTHQRAVRKMEPEIRKSRFASLDAIETEAMVAQEEKESDGRNGDLANPKSDKVGAEVWVKKKVIEIPNDVEASTSYSKGKKNKKGGAKTGQIKAKINGLSKESNLAHMARTKQQSEEEQPVRTSGQNSKSKEGKTKHHRANVVVSGKMGFGPKDFPLNPKLIDAIQAPSSSVRHITSNHHEQSNDPKPPDPPVYDDDGILHEEDVADWDNNVGGDFELENDDHLIDLDMVPESIEIK